MKPINLFAPDYDIDACLSEIRECLERGWTGAGYKTEEFEAAFKTYTALPHAHYLNSATAGLHLALEVLKREDGWHDGDEVITTAFTFVSTNHSILHVGLTPVFCDVDDGLCLDPALIEQAITPRTRAVMFVGMGGNAGQWTEVVSLCSRYGLRLILDAAHQAGTRIGAVVPSASADVGVFSFQAVKNLGTADGGMICFADGRLDERARRLAWMGIDRSTYKRTAASGRYQWSYEVEEVGYKYHGNSVLAALGIVQLRRLERDNVERRRLAARYDTLLEPIQAVTRVPVATGCTSSRHLYQIEVADRSFILGRLVEGGIHAGVHYRLNTDHHPYRSSSANLPRARRASESVLSLPLHLKLTDDDVDRVAETIAGAVESSWGT